jgi:hypothetical protein
VRRADRGLGRAELSPIAAATLGRSELSPIAAAAAAAALGRLEPDEAQGQRQRGREPAVAHLSPVPGRRASSGRHAAGGSPAAAMIAPNRCTDRSRSIIINLFCSRPPSLRHERIGDVDHSHVCVCVCVRRFWKQHLVNQAGRVDHRRVVASGDCLGRVVIGK